MGQRLTVLVNVVVGGDVALQVGGAVRHQAAIILDTLGAVLRRAASREPVLGVTRVRPRLRRGGC